VVAAFSLAEGGLGTVGVCIFLTSLILTVAFWPALIRGKRRDLLYVFAAVLTSALVEYVAFIFRALEYDYTEGARQKV
jgi:hypothetical protein